MQRSNVREGEYKTDITKNQFEYITSYFDMDTIYNHILQNYPLAEIEAEEPYWIDLSTNEFEQLWRRKSYGTV